MPDPRKVRVQRYRLVDSDGGDARYDEPDDDGDWCLASDVAKLEARVAELESYAEELAARRCLDKFLTKCGITKEGYWVGFGLKCDSPQDLARKMGWDGKP